MNRNNVPQDVQAASIVQQPPGREEQQRSASQPVGSHSVSRRKSLGFPFNTCGVLGISAFPEGDNIFAWIGTIEGSKFLSAPCFIDSCTKGKKHCINVGSRIQFLD
ncbi:unnamed protein product [Sphagnum jensenii]|uniref:Uncharacterized protein n=1 Tax=Sphagnum jensenii TaxID=128206 RepID=A0ABP1BMV8_9BRYO